MNWHRPIFEHRHFVEIANIIRLLPDNMGSRELVMTHFIAQLGRTNPKFDAVRFMAACEGKPQTGRDRPRR